MGLRAAALAGVLGIALLASDARQRFYSGEFHGYRISVHDRKDGSGRMMREVTMRAKTNEPRVFPRDLYGTKYADAPYHLGLIRGIDAQGAGCGWSSSGHVSGLEACTQEQVKTYSGLLDHAIDDVVR